MSAALTAVIGLAARWRFPAVGRPFATFALVGAMALLAWVNLELTAGRSLKEGVIASGLLAAIGAAADWGVIRWRSRGLPPPSVEAFHFPGEDEAEGRPSRTPVNQYHSGSGHNISADVVNLDR